MTDAELKSYLFADRLEQAELEQVMLGHFGRATGEGKDMLYSGKVLRISCGSYIRTSTRFEGLR